MSFRKILTLSLIILLCTSVFAGCTWNGMTAQNNERIGDPRALCFNNQLFQCWIWGCAVHTSCNGFYTSDFGETVGSWTCLHDRGTGIWCSCQGSSCSPSNNHLKCDGCEYSINVSGTEVCDGIDNDCDGRVDNGFDCAKNSAGCNANCKRICTSFTYTTWSPSTCPQSGQQTRTIASSLPANCVGGNPEALLQNCSYLPECTIDNWNYILTPATCPQNGQQIREWTKQGSCVNGIQKPESEIIACAYQAPECTYIYSSFGDCEADNLKKRTVDSSSPANCAGTPQLTQACTYFPPTRFFSCSLSDQNNVFPENAFWNDNGKAGNFTQNWNNDLNKYFPETKKAFYSTNSGDCAFGCMQQEKTCALDPAKYCGLGKQLCAQGYWSTCQQGDALICTSNQYCNSENQTCQFCSTEKKNCDRNLLNGCESSILLDKNNCGACGTICSAGSCVAGKCTNTTIDANLCASTTCGPNSTCTSSTGSCDCAAGYSDCDGTQSNGCEKMGSCNAIPANYCSANSDCNSTNYCNNNACTPKECLINSDCADGETCSNWSCITQIVTSCIVHDDCPKSTDQCVDGKCVPLICELPFVVENKECICKGTVCNKVCYSEEGACCKNNWNSGSDSCTISISAQEEIVFNSGDDEAVELVQDAKRSVESGFVARASAQATVAEMKALITIKGAENEYSGEFDSIKTLLANGDYASAENNATQNIEELLALPNKNTFSFIPIIILVFLIAAIGAGILFLKGKKIPTED